MTTLREYLYEKLGTLEERMDRMTDREREVFEREARMRAACWVTEFHRFYGKNCHKEEGRL